MTQQTIVITGASGGNGAAAARQLAAKSAEIVLVGRSPSKTAAVAQALGARSYVADFADATCRRGTSCAGPVGSEATASSRWSTVVDHMMMRRRELVNQMRVARFADTASRDGR